jgi:sialate O-acetylesterase
MPVKAQLQKNQIIISFQYAGAQLKTGDGKALRGFVLRNQKGMGKGANAFINKNKVVISIDKNEKPVKILYGWKPYTDANLVNSEGLPASTFEIKIE